MRYFPPPLRTPSSGVPLGQEGQEERPGKVGSVQICRHALKVRRELTALFSLWELLIVVVPLLSSVWLWPHGLQHARLHCPSPSPRVCSNSCPLNQWCHPTILSFATAFSFCFQPFPASGSFPMSQFFASGAQSIGASVSAAVLSINMSGLISFRIDWFDLLAVQGTLKSLLQHYNSKASILWCSAFYVDQLSHPYMTTR